MTRIHESPDHTNDLDQGYNDPPPSVFTTVPKVRRAHHSLAPAQRMVRPSPGRMPGLFPPLSSTKSELPENSSTIDTRQIPSPVQVQHQDQQYFGHRKYVFHQSPYPLSSTDFCALDDGNSTPRFIRASIQEIPCTRDMLDSLGIPLGIVVQPFAIPREDEVPVSVVDMGPGGPIRCGKCRGYINPHVVFRDQGNRYVCNLCKNVNLIPQDYFSTLDASGHRSDLQYRPELCHGTVDLVAPRDYCLKEPQAPLITFLIDVTASSVRSGLVGLAAQAIRSYVSAQHETTPEKMAIVTFDKTIHFYSFSSDQPEMYIVSDIEDPFIPVEPRVFFAGFDSNSTKKILDLLDIIPSLFENNHISSSALGSGLAAVVRIMEKSGGRIVAFQNHTVNHGLGAISARNIQENLAPDEAERKMFSPQNEYFHSMGETCSSHGISVDLFLCPTTNYIDVATLGLVSSVTGGKMYYYPSFCAARDGFNLIRTLQWSLYRSYVFDGLVRVRVGNGLTIREYHGNFCMRNSTELELARIDPETSFSFVLDQDKKFSENELVGIQVTILHTDRRGQRRIRLINLNLKTTKNPTTVFKTADIESIMTLILKASVSNVAVLPLTQIRKTILERVVRLLAGYRKQCSASSSTGQLVLPETLKLLPVYSLCLLKSRLFCDLGRVSSDVRITLLRLLRGTDCRFIMIFLYPRLYSLDGNDHNRDESGREVPVRPLGRSFLDDEHVYVLENGLELVIWIGSLVSPSVMEALFGDSPLDQMAQPLVTLDTEWSRKMHGLLDSIELQRHASLRLAVASKQQGNEGLFLDHLVEDKNHFGADYVGFLCTLHSQIQAVIDH